MMMIVLQSPTQTGHDDEDEGGDDPGDDTGDDTRELEPEDTLLSDLPHPVSHTTSNCYVKRGVEQTESGDRRKEKHTLDKT